MIPRNTTIPTQKKEIFSTATDSQPSVEIHVLQGERTEARYNRTLGKFHLEGIMPAPRGVPKVEVTFDIDANGILCVHAKDTATGKDQKITITANSGLNEARDPEDGEGRRRSTRREDKERREQIERRNKLDNLCYTLEKTLGENKEKIQGQDVADARRRSSRKGARRSRSRTTRRCTSVSERLEKEAHRLASVMYGAAGAGAGPNGGPRRRRRRRRRCRAAAATRRAARTAA